MSNEDQNLVRDQLLKTAFGLFYRKGYDDTGIQEICEGSGVTKPSLYYHFGNKEGLLMEVAKLSCEPFIAGLKQAAKATGDTPQDIRNIFLWYCDFSANHPRELSWFFSGLLSPKESDTYKALFPYAQTHRQILTQFFSETSLYHGNIRGKELYLALSLPGVIHGYLTSDLPMNDQVITQFVQHFLHGIFS